MPIRVVKALNQYCTEVRVVALEAGVGAPLQPEEHSNNNDVLLSSSNAEFGFFALELKPEHTR